MRITTTSTGHVLAEYTDPITGEEEQREFCRRGPYVYEVTAAHNWPQVCERLDRSGSTLMHNGDLTECVRRELVRLIRARQNGP